MVIHLMVPGVCFMAQFHNVDCQNSVLTIFYLEFG